MKYIEIFKTAQRSLLANKARSLLTMLGVIIGVASVILLLAIGKGIQNFVTDQFNAIGSNLVFVAPGNQSFGRDPATAFGNNKLTERHGKLITTHASDVISYSTPYVTTAKTVKYKNKEYIASLFGGNKDMNRVFAYEIIEGRFYTKAEARSKAKVAIIGPGTLEELFDNQSPINKNIKIEDETFVVIGVLKDKGQSTRDNILIPLQTMERTFAINNYTGFGIKVKDENQIERSMTKIERALLRDLKEDDFTVLSQTEALESVTSILEILTLGLGAIAGISLLVGGIGIMNIMLVTVTERTKEIGLRKAVGATPNNISTQFLVESILLSVGGGTLGIILGSLGSLAPRGYIRTEVELSAIAIAFSVAVAVGIIFGTYPAVKAAKKDPIEALRYE